MATIEENLATLTQIKSDIKAAIIEKGQTVGDNMNEYSTAIDNISGGGSEDDTDYLCFEAIEDSAVSLSNYGGNAPNIEYSFNKSTWTTWDYSNIEIEAGLKVYMRGDNADGFSNSSSEYSKFCFSINSKVNVSGNIMTLIDKNGNTTVIPNNYCFFNALAGVNESYTDAIVNISNLSLSALSLTSCCYLNLFRKCTGLVNGLKELPATIIADSCYSGMFQDCTNLEKCIDVLPATTLAPTCYSGMFISCAKLKNAPYLPATDLISESSRTYVYMFRYCSSILYIKCEITSLINGASTSPSTCPTCGWVLGVASTGGFIKSKNATWTTKGVSACPSGWTLITSVS